MSSVNGYQNLTPDQQLVKYGEILSDLTRVTELNSICAKIFIEQFQGNYQKHPSLHVAHTPNIRYNQHNPAPAIANLIGSAHTILRAGVGKLPKLDIQALDESTQSSIEEFKNILIEYQQLVRDTGNKDAPGHIMKTTQEARARMSDKATRVVEALNASELVKSSTIPVVITSTEGELQHIRVENRDDLGLFLFALPHVSQNLTNSNRVPQVFREFLENITGASRNILDNEIEKVYHSDSLKDQTADTFASMNNQFQKLFAANKRVIQLAALVSILQKEQYISILHDLKFETHLERLENTLEATVVLESLAHNGERKQLDELVRQLSGYIKDNSPPADLLAKTQAALTHISSKNHDTKEKVALLQEYIKRQIEAAPVTSTPGRMRQYTIAVG